MSAITPAIKQQGKGPRSLGQRLRTSWRRLLHPLTAILIVQAGLSLSLVWSNTAFGDEADYLWLGHLLINHWVHGTSWASWYADHILSGSPIIYPPIGALADSVGGLAGARILSLVFMLGTTVLLYLTASRLVSRRAAIIATFIWALSEPVLRLAFATYDPLSILLTTASVWFIVRVTRTNGRCRGTLLIAAAVVSLALANATAYSGIVIDPVVVAFAFLVWLPRMQAKWTTIYVAWLVGGVALLFCLELTISHSWPGIMSTVINRASLDHQSALLVLKDVWGYSALIIALAVIGVIVAVSSERRQRAAMMFLLGATVFVVPLAQLHDQTAYSLDKHLAYGIWFASIAAGYGCDKLIRWVPGTKTKPVAICCVAALVYLAINSWEAAWGTYHQWANAHSFVNALTPVVAQSHGLIYVDGQIHIAEYYTPQGLDWTRWSTTLSLDPALPRSAWGAYYKSQLSNGNYGVIVLFYTTTFSSATQPGSLLFHSSTSSTYQGLLNLVGANSSGDAGLPVLTQDLEMDSQYHLAAKGLYNSTDAQGVYAIWQKKVEKYPMLANQLRK